MNYRLPGRSGLRVSEVVVSVADEINGSPARLEKLAAASRIDLGFPHSRRSDRSFLDIVSGGSGKRIQNQRGGRIP